MNNEVAIKIIKKRIDYLADARTYQNSKSDSYISMSNEIKALLKANEALESKSEAEEYRKPKEVRKRVDKGTDGKPLYIYECPACERVLDSRETAPYCRFCGQALDWGIEGKIDYRVREYMRQTLKRPEEVKNDKITD